MADRLSDGCDAGQDEVDSRSPSGVHSAQPPLPSGVIAAKTSILTTSLHRSPARQPAATDPTDPCAGPAWRQSSRPESAGNRAPRLVPCNQAHTAAGSSITKKS